MSSLLGEGICYISTVDLFAVFQYGLKAMLASADGIPLLVRAINPKVPHMMVDAVRLLSAICILEHTENL